MLFIAHIDIISGFWILLSSKCIYMRLVNSCNTYFLNKMLI